MKYKFDRPYFTATTGYTRLEVKEGLAEVDETNQELMSLVEAHGGKPAPKPKATRKKKAGK